MSNSGLGIYTIKINVCSDKSLSINRALTPPLTLHLLVGRNLISVTKDMMGTSSCPRVLCSGHLQSTPDIYWFSASSELLCFIGTIAG